MQRSEHKLNERLAPWTENNPMFHDMPTRKGVVCTRSKFIFGGTLIISGGTTNGTVLGENPGNLAAQQFQLTGTALNAGYPDGTLKKVVPRTVLRRRIFDHPEKRFIADLNAGITGLSGAAGTFTLNMPFEHYFALPWAKRPFDTALDTGMYGSLQWQITNGSQARQFSGNDRTFNETGLYWDVTHDFQRYDGNGVGPVYVLYDDDHTRNIQGANPRLEINKEFPADGLYLDILTMAETTNQVLADTIVNRETMASGTEPFYDAYAADLKADMEDIIGDPSTATTPRTGLYYTPIADDGCLLNAKPSVSMVMDQSNPGTDRLILSRRVLVPIPQQFLQTGGGSVK